MPPPIVVRGSSSTLLNPRELIGGNYRCAHSQSVPVRLPRPRSTRGDPPHSDSPSVRRLDLGARDRALPGPHRARRLSYSASPVERERYTHPCSFVFAVNVGG